MADTGLILLAHGARDARWAEPFLRLRAKIAAVRTNTMVELAFLEVMAPNLASAVDAMIAGGCRSLRIVPLFLGQGGHVRDDIPRLIAGVSARHPDVAIELTGAIGEDDTVLDRIAAVCVQGLPD
ncbi:MAG TPA: CbiX/SirB N-terminal domain-containing protein [Casimicrobiaceae bacterium]